jgi:tetratricopeptide (TPR) repeat protein
MMRKFYLGLTALVFLFLINLVVPLQNVSAQPPTKKQLAQAKKLSDEGDKLFRQKKYREAIDRYQKATAIVPRIAVLHFNIGSAYYNLAENDLAAASLTTALEQGYAPLEVYKIRWYIYYLTKNYDGAIADLEAALKLQPNDVNFLLAAGDIYREKNMDREAVNVYEKAAQLNPNNADLHYFMALSYARMGDFVNQGVAGLKAIQKNTRYLGESWYLVGNSFQRERKFNESAEAYERAVSAKPQLVDAFNSLSQVYQILNRYSDAVDAAKRGLANHPNEGSLYTNLAWYYSLMDRHMDAIAAGKKAVALSPNQAMGYTNLCRAYNDIKEYRMAVETCAGALKINPGDGETNYYIARAYDFLKQEKTATPHYEKAVRGLVEFTKNNPDYADGFYLLGNAYLAVEKYNEAITAFKQCLQLSPKFVKAIYNLGYAYFVKGDKASARVQYNELNKIDPVLAGKLLEVIK